MKKTTKIKRPLSSSIIIYGSLILFALTIIVPVAWIFFSSVKPKQDFFNTPWSWPTEFRFENYSDAWTKAHMGTYMLNSVMVTAMALILLLVLALPCAYVLARFRFKGRKLLNTLYMGGLFINVNYIVVPIFLMLISFGTIFINNLLVLALVYASTALPFTVFLLSSYFITLPKDFEEAAYIDGANYFTTMVRIIFPMAKPSIITVILFNFLAFWNEYIIAMTLMTDDTKKTLPVGLLNLVAAQNAAADYGRLYAGLVIVILPTLILYMIVQKKLTQGMTVGGVKG